MVNAELLMNQIVQATNKDFTLIREIAYQTWPVTYSNILSEAQLSFMLGKIYSDETLSENLKKGHQFLLLKDDTGCLGFAACEHDHQQAITKLHKLYILPSAQGKGAGKTLIAYVERLALENQSKAVSLNVNRYNTAYEFYLKNGYQKTGEIDIPIGDGYLMEDYTMEKKL